jgi:hypothetical protein
MPLQELSGTTAVVTGASGHRHVPGGSGPTLTLEQVGKTIVDLAIDPSHDQDAYLLTPAGLNPVG